MLFLRTILLLLFIAMLQKCVMSDVTTEDPGTIPDKRKVEKPSKAIDECADPELNTCTERQNCEEKDGHYDCVCKDGYELSDSGKDCVAIDECADPELNTCTERQNCEEKDGHYDCVCKDGYELSDSGKDCVETPAIPAKALETTGQPPAKATIKSSNIAETPAIPAKALETTGQPPAKATIKSSNIAGLHVSINAIYTTSITLQVDSAGNYSSMQIELKIPSGKVLLQTIKVHGSASSENITADGLNLTAGEQYSVRIQTSAGGTYTEWSPFSKPSSIDPATPLSVKTSLTATQKISVNWKSGGGVAHKFVICISSDDDEAYKKEQRFDYRPKDLTKPQNYIVQDLEPKNGKTYKVTVRASAYDTLSASSELSIFIKGLHVFINAINTTSITLHVNSAGNYSSMQIELKIPSGKVLVKTINVHGSASSGNITAGGLNLTAGEQYSVRIQTSAGGTYTKWSPFSKPSSIVPATPLSVETSFMTSEKISVNWKSGGGVVQVFYIYITSDDDEAFKKEKRYDYKPKDLTKPQNYKLHDPELKKGKNYKVTVRASADDKLSASSNPSIFLNAEPKPEDHVQSPPESAEPKPEDNVQSPPESAEPEPEDHVQSPPGNGKEDKKIDLNAGSSHFLAYFITLCVISIAGYVIFHNKKKIVAFIVEGRSGKKTKRDKGGDYKLLQSNVEEAKSNLDMSMTTKNYIY